MATYPGTPGNDSLLGGAESDTFLGSAGFDTVNGGVGAPNVFDFSNLPAPLSLLFTASGTGIAAHIDGTANFTNISIAVGTAFADVMNGGPGSETLFGGAGNDSLDGAAGNDVLVGGTGNDTLNGGAGYDVEDFSGLARRSTTYFLQGNGDVLQSRGGEVDTLRNLEEVRYLDGSEHFSLDSLVAKAERLYDTAFGRVSDPSGLHNWVTLLKNGMSLETEAGLFATAPEYIARYGTTNNPDFVELLYVNTLHRGSDPVGKAGWVQALDQGTLTRGQVFVGFSESAEHISNLAPLIQGGRWDADENAAKIARLYDATLGRVPDVTGLGGWKAALDAGTGLTSIAGGFVGSAEFQSKYGTLTNNAFVEQLYVNTLDRASDPGGKASWVQALDSGQLSRTDVVVGFSESAEHDQLVATTIYGFGSGPTGQYGITFV